MSLLKKCHHCGISDSLHEENIEKSQLAYCLGYNGYLHYVYCKKCHIVNIYKPRLFRRTKFVELRKPEKVIAELFVLIHEEKDNLPFLTKEHLKLYRERLIKDMSS